MNVQEFQNSLIQHETALKGFAYKFTNDNEEAQDLLQETYLKALRYRSKFQAKTNISAWLYTIMRNTFINNYRRAVRANTILDKTSEQYFINTSKAQNDEHNPESVMAYNDLLKKVEALHDDYRVPFEMYNTGFKYKEIADELNLPIGTVKSRIFLARKKLASVIGADRSHM